MKKVIALALGITAVAGAAIAFALIRNGCKGDDEFIIPDDDYEPDDEDYWNAVSEDEHAVSRKDINDAINGNELKKFTASDSKKNVEKHDLDDFNLSENEVKGNEKV